MGVLFSACVAEQDRQALRETVRRLGGRVVDGRGGATSDWTHFVTLAPRRGDPKRGFQKSLNTLVALAAGLLRSLCPALRVYVRAYTPACVCGARGGEWGVGVGTTSRRIDSKSGKGASGRVRPDRLRPTCAWTRALRFKSMSHARTLEQLSAQWKER